MSELSYRDDRVAVYDNFLSETEQRSILGYLDAANFRNILPGAWGKAYRLIDGAPLVGAEAVSELKSPDERAPAYPTNTALDVLFERLIAWRDDLAGIVGEHGKAWSRFTMCPYVYPVGAGLGWHTDSHCAGAYIYYAHRDWGSHWGGELLVGYTDLDCEPCAMSSRSIIPNEKLESALRRGMGYYFAPTPNRLVVLRARTPHMIKRVDQAAGENLRLSLSGFFLPPAGIATM